MRTAKYGFVALLTIVLSLAEAPSASAVACAPGEIAEGDYCYTDDGASATIVSYFGAHTDLTGANAIPSTLGGLPVTVIGDNVFEAKGLTAVTLPSSVTAIGVSAFFDNSLTTLTIPNSVSSLGDYAFEDNSLGSLTLSESLTVIPRYAFANNLLVTVSIPDSVTALSDRAFRNNLLTSLTLGDHVSTIGYQTFSENTLETLTLPGSVTFVDNQAFSTNSLTMVTIGGGVTHIGSFAFDDNPLTSVVMEGPVLAAGLTSFGPSAPSPLIHVRAANAAGYTPGSGSWLTSGGSTYSLSEFTLTSPATSPISDSITVAGTGFAPAESFEIWLHSTPVSLGTFTADATGSFSETVTFPASAAVGAHRLIFVGASTGTASNPITLEAVLAATGVEPLPWLLASFGLIGVGIALTRTSRLRTR